MIQLHKKYLFVVCMFSVLFVSSAVQAYTLNPTIQKVLGYTEKSLGVLCTIGASVVVYRALDECSMAELSHAYNQSAGDTIGVLAGYTKKMVLPIVLISGGFYLMERGEQDLQQAEVNQQRAHVQKKIDEWVGKMWFTKK